MEILIWLIIVLLFAIILLILLNIHKDKVIENLIDDIVTQAILITDIEDIVWSNRFKEIILEHKLLQDERTKAK